LTFEALATSTDTRLGGTVELEPVEWVAVVVVVEEVAAPLAAPVPETDADGAVAGWMTPRRRTVATTNPTSTMAARTTGAPRPLDPLDAGPSGSGGVDTGRQPANRWGEKQGFRQGGNPAA
jgi:hypothetical protein